MRDDRRNADASCAGKFIHRLRRRARTLGFKEYATDLIEFMRGHSRADRVLHLAQRFGANTPDGFEVLNVFLGVGCHLIILILTFNEFARQFICLKDMFIGYIPTLKFFLNQIFMFTANVTQRIPYRLAHIFTLI